MTRSDISEAERQDLLERARSMCFFIDSPPMAYDGRRSPDRALLGRPYLTLPHALYRSPRFPP